MYVTGHSMGGAGALYAGTTKRFAAVVPVAPAGSVRAAELTLTLALTLILTLTLTLTLTLIHSSNPNPRILTLTLT